MARAEKTGRKQRVKGRGRPFAKGRSGNPAGRPKGALNRSSRVAAALLEGEAEALARKVVELALAGDVTALRVCLERLVPPVRERTISTDLPPVTKAADLPVAVARILAAVAAGELTPGEGERIAGILARWREAVELTEIEARLAALEGAR